VGLPLVQMFKQAGLASRTSEALRMIDQGAICANGERVANRVLIMATGEVLVLRVWKRKIPRVTLS
jgi:tyrosyl-tRNA synthetase